MAARSSAAGVLWRLARRSYASDRTGIGARNDGGRWNWPGTAIIYAARSISIAALEKFVHLAGVVPPDLVLVRVRLPDHHSSEEPDLEDLPSGWDIVPAGPNSMEFGSRWARETRSLVLYVPSVLVREEVNAVLNPSHPEFTRVKFVIEREFHYDPRMSARRTAGRARRSR